MPKPLPNCHDCAAEPGQPHAPGCDTERCSVCAGQAMVCDCEDHDPLFAHWTGIWPGKAEAEHLGLDLNEFDEQGYDRIFFVKPAAGGVKCLVKACSNYESEGVFDGSVCAPCGQVLRGAARHPSPAQRRIIASIFLITRKDLEEK